MLNSAQLERLEAVWREQGAAIASVLAPGLDDGQIDALLEPHGVRLPAEARRWWGWHNGVTHPGVDESEIGQDVGFYSLEQAVEKLVWEREHAEAWQWPHTFLPLCRFPRGPIAIDTSDRTIAVVYRHDGEVGNAVAADSMGNMVDLWLEMFAVSAWTWDRDDGRWHTDAARIPERAQGMLIV